MFSTKIASTLDPNKTKQSSLDMPELGADESDDNNVVDKKTKRVLSTASTANNKEAAKNTSEASKPARKMKKSRCGECEGFKQPNCEVCLVRLDKPRNGGPNRRREKCARQICSAQYYNMYVLEMQILGKRNIQLCFS